MLKSVEIKIMKRKKSIYASPSIEIFDLHLSNMLDNLSAEGNAPNYEYGGSTESSDYNYSN